eukprot:5030388-Prymnesium_polylepis.1
MRTAGFTSRTSTSRTTLKTSSSALGWMQPSVARYGAKSGSNSGEGRSGAVHSQIKSRSGVPSTGRMTHFANGAHTPAAVELTCASMFDASTYTEPHSLVLSSTVPPKASSARREASQPGNCWKLTLRSTRSSWSSSCRTELQARCLMITWVHTNAPDTDLRRAARQETRNTGYISTAPCGASASTMETWVRYTAPLVM